MRNGSRKQYRMICLFFFFCKMGKVILQSQGKKHGSDLKISNGAICMM